MMTAILTYNGYLLTECQSGGWRSEIDGKKMDFDSIRQWREYIDNKDESRRTVELAEG